LIYREKEKKKTCGLVALHGVTFFHDWIW